MKIGDSSSPRTGPVAGAKKNSGTAQTNSVSAAATPEVELSARATQLQEIESTLASTPAINSARVAEIRKAIAEGNFKIDSSRIADGLIDSVRQMLAVKRQQP